MNEQTTIQYDPAGRILFIDGPVPRCAVCGASLIGCTAIYKPDGMFCENHG